MLRPPRFLRRAVLGPLLVREVAGVTLPDGVELRENRWLLAVGGRLAGMGRPAAGMALGHTILVHPRVRPSARLIQHELVHVRQWDVIPFFPLRYLWESLRRGYRNNRFEREARASARNTTPSTDTDL